MTPKERWKYARRSYSHLPVGIDADEDRANNALMNLRHQMEKLRTLRESLEQGLVRVRESSKAFSEDKPEPPVSPQLIKSFLNARIYRHEFKKLPTQQKIEWTTKAKDFIGRDKLTEAGRSSARQLIRGCRDVEFEQGHSFCRRPDPYPDVDYSTTIPMTQEDHVKRFYRGLTFLDKELGPLVEYTKEYVATHLGGKALINSQARSVIDYYLNGREWQGTILICEKPIEIPPLTVGDISRQLGPFIMFLVSPNSGISRPTSTSNGGLHTAVPIIVPHRSAKVLSGNMWCHPHVGEGGGFCQGAVGNESTRNKLKVGAISSWWHETYKNLCGYSAEGGPYRSLDHFAEVLRFGLCDCCDHMKQRIYVCNSCNEHLCSVCKRTNNNLRSFNDMSHCTRCGLHICDNCRHFKRHTCKHLLTVHTVKEDPNESHSISGCIPEDEVFDMPVGNRGGGMGNSRRSTRSAFHQEVRPNETSG